MQYEITFSPGDMQLHAYSDADWLKLPPYVNLQLDLWFSLVQIQCLGSLRRELVSRSFAEAEYRALANTAADIAWVRQVLADLHKYLP